MFRQRIKRLIVGLVIMGLIASAIFVVVKYTDLISFYYTITLDGNGYELDKNKMFVKKNETIDLPELEREGYDFLGWYFEETQWSEDTPITSNITLIAKWSPIPYDITFFVDDETFVQKVNYDTMPIFDGTPTKESSDESKEFKFIGWEPELQIVKGNAFYTAKFQEVTKTFDIKLTMDQSKGGIITGGGEYEYGKDANIIITPNVGYIFIGWYNLDDSLYSADCELSLLNIKQDITLIAKFDVITKNIYYNNIPLDSTNLNPQTYDITNGIIKLKGIEKNGYTFRGWYTESNGNGEKVDTINSSTLKDYTLYAHFTPTQYTINYQLNGGTLPLTAPRIYSIESEDISLTTPTREGYLFIGWTSADNPTPIKDIIIESGSTGNKEFTANWSVITYTITFDVEGTLYTQEVEYGKIPVFDGDTTLPSTPYVRITFIGWQPAITPAKENTIYKATYSYDYNKYTVQLSINKPNAGILSGTGSYNWGSNVNISATPKTGYKFIGWYNNGKLLSDQLTYTIENITKSYSIEGRFELLYKTITYNDIPDNTVNNNPTSYNIFNGIIVLENLNIKGYSFEGWFTKPNGAGNKITEINSLDFEDYTLYAYINIINYSISYDLNGGNVSTTNPTNYNINSTTFTLNNPTKEHYTFLGWSSNENTTPNTTITITQGSIGNKNFKANWKADTYNITFIVDGISIVKQFEYNTMPNYGSVPTKNSEDGGLTTYSFTGWQPQLSIVTGNTTYTAQFESNVQTFTLTLNPSPTNGGSIQGGGTYAHNATIQISATPNTGYTFNGWYKGNTLYNANENVTINGLAENLTLTAKFNVITTTITYINTKGASNPNPTSYNIHTSNIILQDISINGYNFKGWYTGENGSGTKITTINTESLQNYTLYAHFELIQYTITYNLNGGEPLSNPTNYNVETPSFTLQNPTKAGHTFVGWKLSNSTSAILNVTITQGSFGNKEYTAYYTINQYIVTFKGYDMNISIADKYVYNDKADKYYTSDIANSLENKILDGAHCTFLGWSLEENSHNYIDLSTYIITEDTTFFAIFNITKNSYFITIDTNKINEIDNISYNIDGDSHTLNLSTTNTIAIEHSQSITINIKLLDDSPYSFGGWYQNGNLISDNLNITISNVTSAINITAKIISTKYTITYNIPSLNGADNPNTQTYYTIEDNDITLQNPTLIGYTFMGWYTGANGSGVKITTISTSSSQNYTLYAHWQAITYSIRFIDSKGMTPNEILYIITDNIITLPTLTLTEYKFEGWYEGSTKYEYINPLTAKDYILESRWTLQMFTMSFEVDGTELDSHTISAICGSTINAPSVDSSEYGMTGYNIDGWYIDEECTTPYTFSQMPSADITLYGEWDYFIYQGFYPYLEEFQSATTNNITYIDSYDELLAWFDYVMFYNITSQYQLQITYKSFSTSDAFSTELYKASDNHIFPGNGSWKFSWSTPNKCKMYMSVTHSDTECTQTADIGKNYIYDQQDYAFARDYTQVRSDNNSNFNINKVQDTLEVTTSNQLMYALEIGVRPICVRNSPAENVYIKAQKVLNQICDDSMSDIDKIKAIYEWLLLNVEYDNYAFDNYQDMWWEYDAWFAEGVFNNGVAVCDGISKALSILAKIENIPVVRVHNLKNTINNNGHAWNKVYINNNWYGIDATHGDWSSSQYSIAGVSYSSFLFTDDYKENQTYIGSIRTELVADSQYNYYASQTYTYNNSTFDLNIDSQNELTLLLMYIKNSDYDSTYITIDISLSNSYTVDQFKEFLKTSLTNASYQWSSYLFIYNTNTNGRKSYTIFLK